MVELEYGLKVYRLFVLFFFKDLRKDVVIRKRFINKV